LETSAEFILQRALLLHALSVFILLLLQVLSDTFSFHVSYGMFESPLRGGFGRWSDINAVLRIIADIALRREGSPTY